jgi:hypothetical protein
MAEHLTSGRFARFRDQAISEFLPRDGHRGTAAALEESAN